MTEFSNTLKFFSFNVQYVAFILFSITYGVSVFGKSSHSFSIYILDGVQTLFGNGFVISLKKFQETAVPAGHNRSNAWRKCA